MADVTLPQHSLPVGSIGRIGLGWWGLACLIATEGALFTYLLFSYAYLAVQGTGGWPPDGPPSFLFALPLTVVAILGSGAAWWAERGVRQGMWGQLLLGLLVAFLLGLAFIALELLEWRSKSFSLSSGAYGSAFFVMTGLHLVHVVAGVLALLLVLVWSALGYFDARRNAPVLITAAYWHFVNAVWLVFFVALYVAPYLG